MIALDSRSGLCQRSIPMGVWQLCIDTGGTFTDCVAKTPTGDLRRCKVLSSGTLRVSLRPGTEPRSLCISGQPAFALPALAGLTLRIAGNSARVTAVDKRSGRFTLDRPCAGIETATEGELCSDETAPILAARLVTSTPRHLPLPRIALRLATTRGTNALLTRGGAPTALFITRGFGDLLRIGDQSRPDIFALRIKKTPPLHSAVVEVDERISADGSIVRPLDSDEFLPRAKSVLARGIKVAAVALVNSYRNPHHELEVAERLRAIGFDTVCCSVDASPLIKLLHRAETALVNAYLTPAIDGFLDQVSQSIAAARLSAAPERTVRNSPLLIMNSAGGLMERERFQAKDSLLSGPAAGVVGAAAIGEQCGFERVLSLDMGGTSTDVSRFEGRLDYRQSHGVGPVRLSTPMVDIETVAAGGGSICSFTDGQLHVGPESAGAVPGPACYGRNGPLTLTDVNLLLGRLSPEHFAIPLAETAAQRAQAELSAVMQQAGIGEVEETVLQGLITLADEQMADAIRRVSIRRGYDPRDYPLVAFGGAGPMHACGVAERLGINTILVPGDAGLLSAVGLGRASIERVVQRQLLLRLGSEPTLEPLAAVVADAEHEALAGVERTDSAEAAAIVQRVVNMRYLGQDETLEIDYAAAKDLKAAFEARHQALYGHRPSDREVELESLRVIARAKAPPSGRERDTLAARTGQPRRRRAFFDTAWTTIDCVPQQALATGDELTGPCLVVGPHSTTVVAPGWSAERLKNGTLIARRAAKKEPASTAATNEAIQLELFSHRLTAAAEEMGAVLQRTAVSTNIKERLDYSCAVLDAQGELVVNAPHIPVHLGALGLCVRRTCAALPLGPGDVAITNHPGYGGSHLPDVTVITPVHHDQTLVGYVASRAHHAEIGGKSPGSMPPDARCLADEGVVISPTYLLRRGQCCFDSLAQLLRQGPWPSRCVEDNLADVRAQLAANHRGQRALAQLARRMGTTPLRQKMVALKARAERAARAALSRLPSGEYEYRSTLDDGTPIRLLLRLDDNNHSGQIAEVDFSGSGQVHDGNLNATPAIVRAAVMYVLRLLVDRPLPLNEGFMVPVRLVVPTGFLNPGFDEDPRSAPAVVGGNVETSQRVVDSLLQALNVCAASQGTMNNLLFGNDRFAYFETLGGGAGAGPGFDGASAVQVHMTNTRITDVEVLEHRYPVRVERFALRRESGGRGQRTGGDGLIRELAFLAPLRLSLLTQGRRHGAAGLAGGAAGQPGRQWLERVSGESVKLAAIDGADVYPEDRLIIETPGGGGWGGVQHKLAGGHAQKDDGDELSEIEK